ncbi:MAG: DinB family protein [Saprospiraceae bacterium]|nr:DinB family protein [Saprospiraceae bacterium]
MTKGQELLVELELELEVTRKYLERVPFNKKDFQPAEKSEKLGRLAIHVAEIVGWWGACINADKLDFIDFEPEDFDTNEALVDYFDGFKKEALSALSNVKDEELKMDWSMIYGEQVLFKLPKYQVLRIFCMNHLVHHRAQLGVYLRMLDIPLPAVYGPSADEDDVILIRKFGV